MRVKAALASLLTNHEQPEILAFWTPYADWIYVVVSSTAMLVIIVLVLRPKP